MADDRQQEFAALHEIEIRVLEYLEHGGPRQMLSVSAPLPSESTSSNSCRETNTAVNIEAADR